MNAWRTVAALAAILSATATIAVADESTGSVFGRVYFEGTKRPVCNLPVRLYSNREPNQRTLTRSDGSFLFLAVFPGYVTVSVPRAASQRIEVHANLESDATFYMRRGYGGETARPFVCNTSSMRP